LPKKYGLAKEASFGLKTSISSMNLKLHATTCPYLRKTYNQIVACGGFNGLNTIVKNV